MPNARTHERFNITVWGAIIIASIIWDPRPGSGWIKLGFIFGTYYLSPDLDLEGTKPDQNWGFLQFIFNPYAKLMKHRGRKSSDLTKNSHVFILGSLFRIVYLALVLTIGYCIIQFIIFNNVVDILNTGKHIKAFGIKYHLEIAYFFIGIVLSSGLHLSLDYAKDAINCFNKQE